MNKLEELCNAFFKTLVPGDRCSSRILFKEMDLGIVKQNIWFNPPEPQIHMGESEISYIDYSAEVLLIGFKPEEVKQKHKAFVPDSKLTVRTLFFKDGRKIVRLYNKTVKWSSDRHKIDLIEFLKRTHDLDDITIPLFEKFVLNSL
jgi:hypothetical protein